MPFLHFSTTLQLEAQQKAELSREIAECVKSVSYTHLRAHET